MLLLLLVKMALSMVLAAVVFVQVCSNVSALRNDLAKDFVALMENSSDGRVVFFLFFLRFANSADLLCGLRVGGKGG